ncbi:zinc-binding dehydrogenase [Achromobacter sp. 77]|nr:zinc-binding dehydrogenase [Achromobacter sp. 77]
MGWGKHALAPQSFREATWLVEAGKLMPYLAPRRFDLRSAEVAYEAISTATARGKIVADVA